MDGSRQVSGASRCRQKRQLRSQPEMICLSGSPPLVRRVAIGTSPSDAKCFRRVAAIVDGLPERLIFKRAFAQQFHKALQQGVPATPLNGASRRTRGSAQSSTAPRRNAPTTVCSRPRERPVSFRSASSLALFVRRRAWSRRCLFRRHRRADRRSRAHRCRRGPTFSQRRTGRGAVLDRHDVTSPGLPSSGRCVLEKMRRQRQQPRHVCRRLSRSRAQSQRYSSAIAPSRRESSKHHSSGVPDCAGWPRERHICLGVGVSQGVPDNRRSAIAGRR